MSRQDSSMAQEAIGTKGMCKKGRKSKDFYCCMTK
jgi:hypothetical protein